MGAEINRVIQLVEDKIKDTDAFIVDVKMTPDNRLIILLDSDTGLPIELCAAVSRYVGFHLEEENVIDHAYVLEVSSPGVGHPLKIERQYIKNIGRVISVKLKGGDKEEGVLVAVEPQFLLIEKKVKEKGKKEQSVNIEISKLDIEEVRVVISFK